GVDTCYACQAADEDSILNLVPSDVTDNDYLEGGKGNDTIYGESGMDVLSGGTGDDILYGGDQTDLVFGGDGADVLEGGTSFDLLFGGAGEDTASYESSSASVYVNLAATWENRGGDAGASTIADILGAFAAGTDVSSLYST